MSSDPIGVVPGQTPEPQAPYGIAAVLRYIPLQERLGLGINQTYAYIDGNPLGYIYPYGLTPPWVVPLLNNYAIQAGAAGQIEMRVGEAATATGDPALGTALDATGLFTSYTGLAAVESAQLMSPDLPGTVAGAGIDIATSRLPPPWDVLTDAGLNQAVMDLLPRFLPRPGLGQKNGCR